MRVLFCHRPDGAFGYITDGMINALRSVGHVVDRWDGTKSSWDNFAPDLYCGASGHQQTIPSNRGRCKVAIHVNPYGPYNIEPNINESKSNIDWVLAQNPDVVFGYGREQDRELWSYWEGNGVSWIPMPTAGDITKYSPDFDHYGSRDLDMAYVGGRWSYKAQNIDKFLLPILQRSKMTYSLHGWGSWPSVTYRGSIEESEVPALFRRAKVGPCVSEPHTLVWGIDLPERVFKIILSGAVAVHDPVSGMSDYLSTVTACFDPDDYASTIKMICKWDTDKRLELARKQYIEVCSKHTYHHRIAKLFAALGWANESTNALEAVDGHIDNSCRQLQV